MWSDLFYPLHRWLMVYMGRAGLVLYGDAPDTPAPDPRLVQAQIESLGIQGDAIKRIMAVADQMAPLQREQMELGVESTRRALDESQADRAYSLERRDQLTTLQDRQIKDAADFNVGIRGSELAAQGVADVGMQAEQARQAQTRQQQRMGVNPASGKAVALDGQMRLAEAAAKAGAANTGREKARLEGYSLTDRAANSLSGYPSMGLATTGAGAQYGAAGLSVVQQGLTGLNSGNTAAVSGAGAMGSNATGMFNAQANYQAQMENADSGLWGALGTLGGAAITKFSDRRLKRNIRKLSDDSRGFSWYAYEYIWGGGEQVGVMADEIEQVMPHAVTEHCGFKAVHYGMLKA